MFYIKVEFSITMFDIENTIIMLKYVIIIQWYIKTKIKNNND